MTDPYGRDGGAFMNSWAVGLDTDLPGGATVVSGSSPTTVTTTFLGLPFDLHPVTSQLSFTLIVDGVSYPAKPPLAALLPVYGFFDFPATVTLPVSVSAVDAAHSVWMVTDSSGASPVTQYFSQG